MLAYRENDFQRRPNCAFGIVFVRHGPAEIRENAVADVPRDRAVVTRDYLTAMNSIPVQQVSQLFGVELFTQGRRAHEVAEHHRELAAFAGSLRRDEILSRIGRPRQRLNTAQSHSVWKTAAVAFTSINRSSKPPNTLMAVGISGSSRVSCSARVIMNSFSAIRWF